ncbi:M20/M25/M40 family metallo-hydrolase [Sandarakinorhabdus limnophila]|uniref:M20/M25/M40 family metallo-hydrolase n=1 Tax=Sandarakinorhabdus limnophila TaxID=210512 RepID=UPI0026EE9B27|nr:M20/M25/M40 family metallo-hydrolase [Sandarakinorhabdus limnophila]
MNRWPLLLLTLCAGLLLGWWTIQTPTPVDASAPADQFSAGRAMADVRVLARAPHPTGTPANRAGIAHMERRLAALGFTTRRVVTPLTGKPAERLAKWGGDPSQPAISLIAIRPGGDAAVPAVALLAHHDSVWASPGAADDIAGVAAALEIARAIPQASQRRDLVLIFTDAEELGLVGARAVYRDNADPIAARTGVTINLEARGGGGRAMMFQTGPQNGDLVRRLAAVAPSASASSLAVTLYESLPNDTDFTPVKLRGQAGLNFAFIGDAWGYHSPLMTAERLDQGALQHLGDSALAITRDLVTVPELPARTENAVFASAPFVGIIAYSPATGWVLLAAIGGLLVLAAVWRRGEWTLGGMLMALGQAVLALIIAGVLMFGLNLLSGSVGAEYYDRLAALPRLEVVAALAALAVLLFLAAAPAGSLWDRWLAWAALCFAGALVAQILLPGAGPVLAWPALLAAIAAVLGARPGATGMAQVAPAALLAIPGLALGAELFHFAFLGIGAPMPYATVPLLIPVLALLAPMLPDGPGSLGNRRPALLAGGIAVLLAACLALWVNLDERAPSVPPYAGTEKSQG